MSRFAGMNIGFPTTARDRNREAEQLKLYNQSKKSSGPTTSNIISGANIAPNNIFKKVGTNNNMPIFEAKMPDRFVPTASQMKDKPKSEGFFKKADPTPMNQLVKPSYLVGSPTVEKGLSQYDALTNLTKMREMSLSGKLKGLAPVYEEGTGRIIKFEPSNVYQYITPGYDLDGVAFSEKQSAMRTGIDPKAYQAMGLGERASHLGTEVKSMGSELGTGFSRVVDDAKGIISNLPFWSIFGSGTTNQSGTGSDNTGVMSNVNFQRSDFDDNRSARFDPLAGMAADMRAFYMGLSPEDRQKFLSLDAAGRQQMMTGSTMGQMQNTYKFLGREFNPVRPR